MGQTHEIVQLRMSQIEERRELNPRGKLDHETIQDYVRVLKNGGELPPVELHRKNVIFDGAHRFHAYKLYHGDRWQDATIPVIYRDDIPDPDEDADLYRLAAAIANGKHGLRVTRYDRRRVMAEVYRRRGEQILRKYAAALNETQESITELVASLEESSEALAAAVEAQGKDRAGNVVALSQQPTVKPRGFTRFRPEGSPTGYLRSVTPVIRTDCRRLRASVERLRGALTEADISELEGLVTWLQGVISDWRSAKSGPRRRDGSA